MMNRFGVPTALFAIKCFLAAMLALYLAFLIPLDRPYWAVATTFIVAQPLAGAVVSKAVFRLGGTIIGAAVAVALVPALVDARGLLIFALAAWLGLCVYFSILDRTPRAYFFVLAGFSACLIGIPSVDAPGGVFDVALQRVEEISLGILCGTLVHGLILPRSVAAVLMQRIDATLADAEKWSRESISTQENPELDAERRRLALDIAEMQQLSTHLPFEIASAAPRVRTVRALQEQLSVILPLASAVDDRMRALTRDGQPLPTAISVLLKDCCAWLAAPGAVPVERRARAEVLRTRAAALEPEAHAGMPWRDALALNLLARLSALIETHADCRDLRDQIAAPTRAPVSPRVDMLVEASRGRELHRDYGAAQRGAVAAALTLIVGNILWIASGWVDGAQAVALAGVFVALFAAQDDPAGPLKGFMIGVAFAIPVGALYGYAILPRLDGFAMLAAAFAPALLVGGAVMASPRYGVVALAAMVGLSNPLLFTSKYVSDFASYANFSLAFIGALLFAHTMVRLLLSAGAETAVRRALQSGWRDIAARSTQNSPPDVRGWSSRMIDRLAFLTTRLAVKRAPPGTALHYMMRDLKTGVLVGELRSLRLALPPEEAGMVTPVLAEIGTYYRELVAGREAAEDHGVLDRIDATLGHLGTHAAEAVRRTAILSLVSLRRTLFPDAPPPAGGIA